MPALYRQLVQDHVNLSRVLEVLQIAVEDYDADDWYHPNMDLILDALEYIRAYPEVFHHPLEERSFDYLLQHRLVDPAIIAEIRAQHSELEEATERLQAQFDAIADECVVPQEELKANFAKYLTLQLHHLQTENEKVFPILAEIEDKDWWDIASCMVLRQDPIFGDDPAREHFNTLAKSVIASMPPG